LAAIATFGIVWTLSRFSRQLDNTGSSYVFISRSFGDRAGTAFGTLNYAAVVLGPPTPLIFGGFVSDYLNIRFGLDIPWWLIALGLVAAIGVAVSFGVEFSSRVILVVATVGMSTIIAFSVLVIVHVLGRGDVSAAAPLQPSSSGSGWLGVFWGMLFGLAMFGGFDSAQNLAEEARDPKRSVPRAMLITVILMAVYFVVVSYAQVVGFGMDSAAMAEHPFPLLALAAPGSFGSSWLVDLFMVLLILDDFTLCVAGCVYASRGLFALARDGRLPSVFTVISRKRSIPVAGMAVQVAWMAVLVVVVHLTGRYVAPDGVPEYMPMFVWIGTAQGLITSIISAAVCLGAFGWLRRRDKNPVILIVAASVGAAAAGVTLLVSMVQASTATYVALVVIFVFLVISFVQSTILLRQGKFAPATFLEDA
jgi:amino acid transporter